MYLFFDTETTGTPRNYKAPVSDLNNWPRLVQIAWILFDEKGNELTKAAYLIKPSGFKIPADASNIHGITTEQAQQHGVELLKVLQLFNEQVNLSHCLVAHNINFDKNIIGAEFLRNKMTNPVPAKKLLCTMESSVDYCALKGPYGYKWPKLAELHHKLFKNGFDGAHSAMGDIEATSKCFWEMRKRGLI